MLLIRLPFDSVSSGVGYAVALLLLVGAAPPEATAQVQDIILRGFILQADTGQPLPGANVVVERLDAQQPPQGAAANSNGYYHIAGLAPGAYALRASFIGYRTLRDTLRLVGNEERITYTIELSPAEETLEELVVTDTSAGATPRAAGLQRVDPEDLARIPTPSVSGDLANYLQSLPGVIAVGDRGGQFFIRGGTPDQNLILMDRIQIYRPFHIVGFYSAFPQEIISGAEIYAGGFPASYNGRISSVIDVEMRSGNREHIEAGVTASPFLTGLRAEGPLNDDGLSLLAATRFSQIERTAPVFLDRDQPLAFDDLFVKLQNITETGRCSMTGLHTYDRGQIDPERDEVFKWSNYAFGGRCLGFGSGSSSLVDVSTSFSYVQNAVGEGQTPERDAELWDIATKVDIFRPLEGSRELRGGLRLHYNRMVYSLGEKFHGFRTDDETLLNAHGYVEGLLPLGQRFDLRSGLAVTFPVGIDLSVEPRLRASWRPFGSDAQQVDAAVGFYRQSTIGLSDERDLGSVFTAWVPSSLERGRPAAWHAILGWRQRIGAFGLTVEGYYKDLKNLTVPVFSARASFTTELMAADGTTWGFDLRGEFDRGPVYAHLGYGYSWTRYTAAEENFGSWLGTSIQTYHPPHDRRHTLNAMLSARLGFATADLQWQLGSGLPYTKPFGFDLFIDLEGLQESPRSVGTPRLLYEKPYRARLPAYHRLDVSLKRTFEWNAVELTTRAGGLNLYDRRNLFYFDLFTQRRVDQLPFVPYVAIELSTN